MVLDTSAIIAILLDEPEAAYFVRLMSECRVRLCSVVSFVEASIVIENRKGRRGLEKLDSFLQRADVEITAVDIIQARKARDAYLKFGKGKHPAGLNLGDCFSHALATVRGEELLYKGNDFAQTNVQSAGDV